MDVAPLHQTEHLACHAAHLKRFEIERAGKRIESAHDVRDGLETMEPRVWRFRPLGSLKNTWIRFLDHLLAKVHANQIVLKYVVVEHVLGNFAKIYDPFAESGRTHTERHILRVRRAGGVVIAADTADSTGDEVGVARVFPLHENAVATEDGRCGMALRDAASAKVNLREDPEAAHNSGNRVPIHLDEVLFPGRSVLQSASNCSHLGSFGNSVGLWVIPGGQFRSWMPPFGFLVDSCIGETAERSERASPQCDRACRERGSRRFVHERHELVRKPRHSAANAYPADVWTPADTCHPAALGDIAIHYWSPAAQLDDALRRAVLAREIGLLVVTSAVASLVNRLSEKPGRTQLVIERNHWGEACDLIEEVKHGFHEVVRLDRTTWHVDDRKACFRTPLPTEIIREAHTSRWVPGHCVNSAVCSAGPDCDHRSGLLRQPINPFVCCDWLTGFGVGADCSPVALFLDLFVGDRALDHQNERLELSFRRLIVKLHEVVADFIGKDGIMQVDLWKPWNGPEHDIFDARLHRGRHRY